ncbi:alpha/beta fold hydrolase [Pedobacter sp. N23S346]|uniref:alpha/beta fold hydrolase n=1 Tax=Pedobacter sp. N23S346 TaxID=3402750 RepID=UPI003ACD3065
MNHKKRILICRPFIILQLLLLNFFSFAQGEKSSIFKQFKKDKKTYENFEEQHGHYVKTENVLMHYLSWGNPKSTPLIWIHGSLMNTYELAPIAKFLTDAGYYLIAIDYYGHGKTPIPEKEVSLYHIADDIIVMMDSLQIKKAVIGGFSRGGYVASVVYQSYPDRVEALILEDGGSVAFNAFYHKMSEKELDAKAKTMNLSPEIKSLYNGSYSSDFEAYAQLYDSEKGGDQFDLLAVIKPAGDKWIIYQGLMDYFSMANDKEFRNLVLRPAISPLYAASITYIEPRIIFRNLNVPVLILDPVSDNDPMPFTSANIQLAAAHPRFIIRKEYEGVEHNIHYAKPQQFVADLTEFLARVRN